MRFNFILLISVDEEDLYTVAFSTVTGIGPARFGKIISRFGSAKAAWKISAREIAQSTGLPGEVVRELDNSQKKLNVDKYVENLLKRKIKFLVFTNKYYPDLLKNISDPPITLFIKSELSDSELKNVWDGRMIGVVGTRQMTAYGREVTESLVKELVAAKFTIVSGMALGVDGTAHRAAINSSGKTVAVLGAGVDIVYPAAHLDLYNSILKSGGVIVSEVPPGKTVNRGIFPARNRIISGLCTAVLVTEGAISSGSLITAKMAAEQGREVFAVPGPINSRVAQGTNLLIKQGAKPVTGIEDIFEGLGIGSIILPDSNRPEFTGSAEEEAVLKALSIEGFCFDDLARVCSLSPESLNFALSKLEVAGKIRFDGENYRLLG